MGDTDVIRYNINEIFRSVQGEGTHAGMACTFIRFASCNLNCKWCDTKNLQVQMMPTSGQIVTMLDVFGCKNVVLTGGEPMIQLGISDLIVKLLQAGFNVHIETNGTRPLATFPEETRKKIWVTCSPKPANKWFIDQSLEPDEFKYVIDEEIPIEKIVDNDNVYLMPQDGWSESLSKCLQFMWARPLAKLGIQAHKYWGIK
jgi:organic radical activating enzyme